MSAAAEALGRRVRAARESAGMSQDRLARLVGLHQGSLARTEAGDRPLRALEAVVIARVTDTDLDELLRGDDAGADRLMRETAATVPQEVQRRLDELAHLADERIQLITLLADELPQVADERSGWVDRALQAWRLAHRAAVQGSERILHDLILEETDEDGHPMAN